MRIYYSETLKCVIIETLGAFFANGALYAFDKNGRVAVSYSQQDTALVYLDYADVKRVDGSSAGSSLSAVITYLNGQFATSSYVDSYTKTETNTLLSTKADLVGGKLATSQVPSIAISEYLGAVASESAMLALSGEVGDWCVRSDVQYAYVITGPNPAILTSWTRIVTPASPVSSVNGQIGAVVLTASDVGAPSGSGTSSGANTGDETTLSIQTKRPLKTVEGFSLEGTGDVKLQPATTSAVATTNTTKTGTTQTVIASMTLTPSAGTYLVIFSSTISSSAVDATITLSIYSGGTQVTNSIRTCKPNFTTGILLSASMPLPVSIQCEVTVNGSQAIEARWSTSSGTATANQRSLNIVKLRN